MELQFDKTVCKSLHKILSQVLEQEITQEIRLPDSLPDIGRVLGSWGQPILRSKEWQGGNIGVSGGVMIWVMYMPENSATPECVEAWLPFQMKWDIPETQRDGNICVIPLVKSVDSRTVSARKLMTRLTMSVLGEAYEGKETEVFQPSQIPQDIQILENTYPVEIPTEAGEKMFQIEQALELQDNDPKIEKVCYYEIKPQIPETRILGDKLLFRGVLDFHLVYLDAQMNLRVLDREIPISQYAQLDKEYDQNELVWTWPVVTGAELDRSQEIPLIKVNLTFQYIIYSRVNLQIIEDMYSTTREISVERQPLQLQCRLDAPKEEIQLSQKLNLGAKHVLDAVWYPFHPTKMQNAEQLTIEQAGVFQVLYLDEEDQMQGCSLTADGTWQILSDPRNQVDIYITGWNKPTYSHQGEDISVSVFANLQAETFSENALETISQIKTGELLQKDPSAPSLVVRKIGQHSLWDIAKQYHTAVSNIHVMEPDGDQISESRVILIPLP